MELSIIIIFRSSAVENVLRSADHEECRKIFLRILFEMFNLSVKVKALKRRLCLLLLLFQVTFFVFINNELFIIKLEFLRQNY